MNIFFVLFFAVNKSWGFTYQQYNIAKRILDQRSCVPQFARIVNAALKGNQLAFTTQDKLTVYVDAKRFEDAPNTFWNVVVHESSHLCGSVHGDGSLAMDYSVRLFSNLSVQNDASRIKIQ